jgi:hypothetical protein
MSKIATPPLTSVADSLPSSAEIRARLAQLAHERLLLTRLLRIATIRERAVKSRQEVGRAD